MIPEGAPVLHLARQTYNMKNEIIEFTLSVARAINFIIRYAIFGIVRRVKYVYSRKEELEQLGRNHYVKFVSNLSFGKKP